MNSETQNSCCSVSKTSVTQTLDELSFERGIWMSALHGDVEDVRKRIARDPSCADSRDSCGFSALHYAARSGHDQVVSLLLNEGKADVNATTTSGHVTPLHRAAYMGHFTTTKLLLDSGADGTIRDSDGYTALDKAKQGKNQKDVIRILMER